MKVSTDACILGAYTPVEGATRVLDIGAGTGLIALMLAQRSNAPIDAVEIDGGAYSQAVINVQQSQWRDRIALFHDSIQHFAAKASHQYDLIVSNPPFFVNSFKSPKHSRNLARHTDELTFDELLHAANRLLADDGKFVVLLPAPEMAELVAKSATHQLNLTHQFCVSDTPLRQPHRIISTFERRKEQCSRSELVIKEENGTYTAEFVSLMKAYYLYL